MGRFTIPELLAIANRGERLTMVTAYDATFARLFDAAGVEMLLVGDSLGMVIQGHGSTLPVTIDDMVYHTRAVARGSERAFVVADMPFMSINPSMSDALRSAGRLLSEGGAQAVKIEGAGDRILPAVVAMVEAGVPVMGHLGLTPQTVNVLGGYRVQGRGAAGKDLIRQALTLQAAGAFAIVLEMLPAPLAKEISEAVSVPTIGIGAGPHCGGQVLVSYDLLGLNEGFNPKFLKQFETLGARVREATNTYIAEVKDGSFPGLEHSFKK